MRTLPWVDTPASGHPEQVLVFPPYGGSGNWAEQTHLEVALALA